MDQNLNGAENRAGEGPDYPANEASQESMSWQEPVGQSETGTGADIEAASMTAPDVTDATDATDATAAGASDQAEVTPPRQSWPPSSTVLTWQDLVDLPGQILPDETVQHLKNAGREAALAVWSLWQNIDRSRKGETQDKVRKHIDVE